MVLVTGGTGLVGAHLLLYLIENKENVRAIYRNLETIDKTKSLFSLYKKEYLFEKIEWIQGDITDVSSLEIAFENIEYVYHSAGMISFDPKDEDLLRKINIEGTANIVNFCIANGVKKLCFVSSTSALGDLKEGEIIITEETEWNPEKPHSTQRPFIAHKHDHAQDNCPVASCWHLNLANRMHESVGRNHLRLRSEPIRGRFDYPWHEPLLSRLCSQASFVSA